MAALFRRSTAKPLCQCHRAAFSTSTLRAISLQWDRNDPEALAEVLPAYPYGPTRWYKQSSKGLYGGQRIQFGNNVGEKFKNKTRRTWQPNILNKRIWSKALNRFVQVRVSARVLRTIDKLGGLDEYLLGEKEARIKELGESGWWLRWAIMQTPTVKHRFARERRALGLPEGKERLEAVEDGEDGEADTEAVTLDTAFQVEHNPNLPPIKFRVGPGKHVMLTSRGWVRTRPSKLRLENKAKEELIKNDKHLSRFVTKTYRLFKTSFDLQQKVAAKHGGVVLTREEKKAIRQAAMERFTRRKDEKVDEVYRKSLERKKKRIAARREKRERKKAAENAESEESAVVA